MAGQIDKLNTNKPVIFGEVLFDRFPDGSKVLGGAPFNVAWHLQAFGAAPLMITRIGDDELGDEIRCRMLEWGMDISGLQIDNGKMTGTVDVTISGDEPCFNITRNSAYDFIDAEALPRLPDDGLIYHGSLSIREETSRLALERLKKLLPVPCFIDVNLRPPWWTEEIINQVLGSARWLKLNEQELATILSREDSTDARIERLMALYPLQYLVVTCGSRGAIAISREGEEHSVNPESSMDVIDTVGAGDAFSSVLLLGLVNKWPLPVTLKRAQEFAGSIVGIRGATINDGGFYRPFLEDWSID